MKILCFNKKKCDNFSFRFNIQPKMYFYQWPFLPIASHCPSASSSPRRKDVVVAVQRQLELELVARGRGRGRGRPEEVNRSNGGSGVGTITMESPIIQSSLRAGPFKPFSAPHLLLVDLETNRFSNETAAIPLSFASCLVLIAKTIDQNLRSRSWRGHGRKRRRGRFDAQIVRDNRLCRVCWYARDFGRRRCVPSVQIPKKRRRGTRILSWRTKHVDISYNDVFDSQVRQKFILSELNLLKFSSIIKSS